MRLPQGVRGAKAPRTVVKFHFLKRFKVLENESIFQKQHIFSCQKIHFSNKNFKNRSYFTRIFEFFGKIYRILIFLEEMYKSREIPDELYYLVVEKFIKKPKMAIMLPPQGVRGAKAPRTVAKFHFLKRFKAFENEFISQKCQHFSSANYPFF